MLKSWKEAFLQGGAGAFQSAETAKEKALVGELKALKAKIGELVMDNDLLYEKIDRLENGVPFHLRKSKR